MKKPKFTKRWVQRQISEEIKLLWRFHDAAEKDENRHMANLFRAKVEALHDILLKMGMECEP